jgi:azurin
MSIEESNKKDQWVLKGLCIAAGAQPDGFMEAYRAAGIPGMEQDSLFWQIASMAGMDRKAMERVNPAGRSDLPGQAGSGKTDQLIVLRPIKNAMKFDRPRISVKAGTRVDILLDNVDFMQHNLLILQPGSLDKVGSAVDALAKDPRSVEINYTPKIPEVLFSTPLINPDSKYHLVFRVPATRGNYPFICSFPGHWRIMQGVMEVR